MARSGRSTSAPGTVVGRPETAHSAAVQPAIEPMVTVGDPATVAAYRQALPLTSGTDHRLGRARLAKAACLNGDVDTAQAALAKLELEGDIADGPVLLARGNLALFTGDTDTAWEVANRARELVTLTGDAWHFVDLVWIFLFPILYLL